MNLENLDNAADIADATPYPAGTPICPDCQLPTVNCDCEEKDPTAPKTYQIPECKIPDLQKKLDRMVKRAHKLEITACSYTLGKAIDVPYITRFSLEEGWHSERFFGGGNGPEELKKAEDAGKIHYKRFIEVTIAGPAPKLAGWTFVATLQHLTDEQGKRMNMLRSSPTFTGKIPDRFKTTDAVCDHCKAIRNRVDTYIVHNESTDEWKQIGSSCIKDFTGGNDPRVVAAILQWWLDVQRECEDFDEDGGMNGGGRGEARWSLRDFLATTAAVIRQEGWLPKSKADEFGPPPTATLVVEALENRRNDLLAGVNHKTPWTNVDEAKLSELRAQRDMAEEALDTALAAKLQEEVIALAHRKFEATK